MSAGRGSQGVEAPLRGSGLGSWSASGSATGDGWGAGLRLVDRLRVRAPSVASGRLMALLCPEATHCRASWSPPPSRPATPSRSRRTRPSSSAGASECPGGGGRLPRGEGSFKGRSRHWDRSFSTYSPGMGHLPHFSQPQFLHLRSGLMLNDLLEAGAHGVIA